MAVLSILGLFQAYKRQNKKEKAAKTNWLHLIKFFLPCLLLMPAMTRFGYILSGIVFLLLIQLLCGQRKLVFLFWVSVLPVTGFYVLMVYALGVPLP